MRGQLFPSGTRLCGDISPKFRAASTNPIFQYQDEGLILASHAPSARTSPSWRGTFLEEEGVPQLVAEPRSARLPRSCLPRKAEFLSRPHSPGWPVKEHRHRNATSRSKDVRRTASPFPKRRSCECFSRGKQLSLASFQHKTHLSSSTAHQGSGFSQAVAANGAQVGESIGLTATRAPRTGVGVPEALCYSTAR